MEALGKIQLQKSESSFHPRISGYIRGYFESPKREFGKYHTDNAEPAVSRARERVENRDWYQSYGLRGRRARICNPSGPSSAQIGAIYVNSAFLSPFMCRKLSTRPQSVRKRPNDCLSCGVIPAHFGTCGASAFQMSMSRWQALKSPMQTTFLNFFR